jgi:GT2 family glycosyltransferase
MIPHPSWLRSLVDGFSNNDDIAAVTGPRLDLETDSLDDIALRSHLARSPWGPYGMVIDRSTPQWFGRANFGGVGDGNFALRRNAFEQIGGFDERLGRGAIITGGEEHYAYFKLIDSNFKILYAPEAIVFHPKSLATRDALRQQMTETIAYVAFVAFNHPAKSFAIIRFVVEGVFGMTRAWRTSSGGGFASLSIRDMLWGAGLGLCAFVRSRKLRAN